MVAVDHLSHPVDLTDPVAVVGASLNTAFDEWGPVLGVGAHSRTDDRGLGCYLSESVWFSGVTDDCWNLVCAVCPT